MILVARSPAGECRNLPCPASPSTQSSRRCRLMSPLLLSHRSHSNPYQPHRAPPRPSPPHQLPPLPSPTERPRLQRPKPLPKRLPPALSPVHHRSSAESSTDATQKILPCKISSTASHSFHQPCNTSSSHSCLGSPSSYYSTNHRAVREKPDQPRPQNPPPRTRPQPINQPQPPDNSRTRTTRKDTA